MLYFKGHVSEFHDIDIMVSEKDVGLMKEIILNKGELLPSHSNENKSLRYKK